MSQASWYPELPAIHVAELDRNVPTKCGAADAHIDCHVQNRATQHSHQLALRPGIFWICRPRKTSRAERDKLSWDKAGGNAGGTVSVSLIYFRKKTSAVAKQFWFNNQHA